jgi:hypothetical protein
VPPAPPEPTLACPSCGTVIRLTEQLAAPVLERARAEMAARETAIAEREQALVRARAAQAAEIEARAQARAAALAAEREAAMAARLAAQEEKLAAAQAAQAEHIRLARALEEERRELALTIERQVAERLGAEQARARAAAEEALRLQLGEKDQRIEAMKAQIDALKRRAEQGSQQLQGEVMELDLETRLRARFPADLIEPVPKGEAGADLVQRVVGPAGMPCGAILWETKRRKNWSEGWLAKLRDDQRALGAEVAILVSEALPTGLGSFDLVDGIWVAAPAAALPLAGALRQGLVALAAAGLAREGQATKMELVYGYLTGPRFRHRIEAVVEKIRDMHEDLARERKAMTRLWAKREAQIEGVIAATVGMYGDLQGIAGKAIREIEGLDLPLLGEPGEG